MSDSRILEKRTFKLLPSEEIGFSKPTLQYTDGDGKARTRVSHDYKAPEPEIARKPGDPGYWTITVWLPAGSTPTGLIPDPDGPQL